MIGNLLFKIRLFFTKTHYSFDVDYPHCSCVLAFKIVYNKIYIVGQVINTELDIKDKNND